EAARLAAARREALEALIGDLRRRDAETQQQLDETEAARLADAAAAEALRERLAKSDAELDATMLELEAVRKQAEETLTLLAAAEAAKQELGEQAEAQSSEA
ncbi:flagellar motor protein MotB, partial [Paracoccus sp. PXZ]